MKNIQKKWLAVFFAFLFCCRLSLPVFAQDTVVFHGKREEKTIALTFDDGPHPKYTAEILEILAQYHIRATFFVIGQNLELFPTAARQLIASGNEIGNHTYNHPHMSALDTAGLQKEIKKTNDILQKMGAKPAALFRPPEGKRSVPHLTVISDMKYKTVLWSVDTHDWAHTPSSDIVENVLTHVKGGDIILFHDFVSKPNTTITALKQLIPELLSRGYRFVTVSELIGQSSPVGDPLPSSAD